MIDFDKALHNSEYARDIIIDRKKDIFYDDYIFILSVIIASNIDLKKWYDVFKKNNNKFQDLIEDASVIHCLSWNDAVEDVIDYCNLYSFNNHVYNKSAVSRDIAFRNFTPFLLKKFKENNTISNDDILYLLNTFTAPVF